MQAHLAEIYGVEVGHELISTVTDAVMDDAGAGQALTRHRGPIGNLRGAGGVFGPPTSISKQEVYAMTTTKQPPVPQVKQPVTDDSIKVRQLSHYQFSWVAGEAGEPGTWTLQLVLDEGAWEEVLTVDADDADNLQDMLSTASTVFFDVGRRTLMFGTTLVGAA
jgi:hypothetical protein